MLSSLFQEIVPFSTPLLMVLLDLSLRVFINSVILCSDYFSSCFFSKTFFLSSVCSSASASRHFGQICFSAVHPSHAFMYDLRTFFCKQIKHLAGSDIFLYLLYCSFQVSWSAHLLQRLNKIKMYSLKETFFCLSRA